MEIPTLAGISLTGMETLSTEKAGNVIPLTIPTGDSDTTEVVDFLGVIKTITCRGTFNLENVAATKAVIDSIEALVNGDQNSTVNFVSDQTGTIAVMIANFSVTWDVPGFKCSYDLKLIQGTAI